MLKTILRSNQIVTYYEETQKNTKIKKTKVSENQAFTNESKSMHKYSFLYDFSSTANPDMNLDMSESSEKFKIERTGYLQYKPARDIKRRLDTWLESFHFYQEQQRAAKKKMAHKLTFVTLTYPSKQTHSDNYCKRHHLNHFIIKSKRDYQVENYLWRAEAQANGNIHFHLIYDKYIHYAQIRKDWNDIIEGDGYITEFKKVHGHSDPNTTDIHGLKDIKSISAYVSKYMTKEEIGENRRRPLEGCLHGCSDKIRDIKQPVLRSLLDDYHDPRDNIHLVNGLVDFIRNSDLVKWEGDNENYSTTIITKIPMSKIIKAYSPRLYTEYKTHYQSLSTILFTK